MRRFAAKNPTTGIGRGASAGLRGRHIEAALSGLLLDFVQQEYWLRGRRYASLAAIPGWTYSRSGTAFDLTGSTSFAANVPRRTSAGLLSEAARTNLFLNSDVGSTQSIVLTAVQHVLSFKGTGSITLSGTATGTLNGTGANNIVQLAFTPTAGSVTFTVSGSVTQVQVEIASNGFRTSYIPTAGASATRGADVASIVGLPFAGVHSVVGVTGAKSTVGFPAIYQLDAGSNTDRTAIYLETAPSNQLVAFMASGNVTQALDLLGSHTAASQKLAARYATNDVRGCRDGVLGAGDTVATLPVGALSELDIAHVGGGSQLHGVLQSLAIWPRASSDAELQAMTL